jgi:hypothetical protein
MQTKAHSIIVRLRDFRPIARWIAVCGLALSTGLVGVASARAETPDERAAYHRIGPTTTVTEVSSGLPFAARVDTGATSCSIHCEAFEIDGPSDDPAENIGKPVRLLVKNDEGQSHWIKSTIADHVTVKTAARADERYKVPLYFRWGDVQKKVLVTLNDRQHMAYPLLLGRNFLKGDFLVDVALEPKE